MKFFFSLEGAGNHEKTFRFMFGHYRDDGRSNGVWAAGGNHERIRRFG